MINVLIPTTEERRPRLEKCIEALRKSTIPILIATYENKDGGFVPAIHKMLESFYDEQIVFCIGDDVIIEPDCIKKLFNEYEKYGPAVYQPFDEINGGAIAVNPFCPAWLMKKYQFKGYMHNYCDVEFTEIVKSLGLYHYIPEAKVEHVHFMNRKAKLDKTYMSGQNFGSQDEELYYSRRKVGFEPKNL